MNSALFVGHVVHSRLRPRRHRFCYRCFWMLFDLDELPKLDRELRLFSHDRSNLFSFCNADHGAGGDAPIRTQATHHLLEAGIDIGTGKVLLLAMPRILGYGFNPLSIYFCYRPDGSLAALICEVHNTFQERHSYLIATDDCKGASEFALRFEKHFHVSPFLAMDLTYDFTVTEPAEAVRVAVRAFDREGVLLNASLAGARVPLTDLTLLKVFVTHPLLTLKVIAAIHWEALRLWWKGIRLVSRPPPPEQPVTFINTTTQERMHE